MFRVEKTFELSATKYTNVRDQLGIEVRSFLNASMCLKRLLFLDDKPADGEFICNCKSTMATITSLTMAREATSTISGECNRMQSSNTMRNEVRARQTLSPNAFVSRSLSSNFRLFPRRFQPALQQLSFCSFSCRNYFALNCFRLLQTSLDFAFSPARSPHKHSFMHRDTLSACRRIVRVFVSVEMRCD